MATGDIGVQEASEWILSHVFDPELDQPGGRDFVVYALPLGGLGSQLQELWDTSLAQTGRNGAHKSFPHVTLCQFFKCDNNKVPQMIHALQGAVNANKSSTPEEIHMTPFSSSSYIGLFMEEPSAQWFRKVMNTFATDASKLAGCKVDPHKKQLHLTLAYQFLASHQSVLEAMAKKVNPKAPARWELRIYSRDARMAQGELYQVLFPHTPRSDDELELTEDDYIMVNPESSQADSVGWLMGTSFLTGCTGLIPANYIEKCPETDGWTLHRAWPATNVASSDDHSVPVPRSGTVSARKISLGEEQLSQYNSPEGLLSHDVSAEYAQIVPKKERVNKAKTSSTSPTPRFIILMRHAERVDVTFGQQWLTYSFDRDGVYHRKNLNMPKSVPSRKGGMNDFRTDGPITEMGLHQARLTGAAMKEEGLNITHVFSSPALRCVQTANAVLQGYEASASLKIRVEYGLFEWLSWCQHGLPSWLSVQEMATFGLKVDPSYKPLITPDKLNLKERIDHYYRRSSEITKHFLGLAGPNAYILIVGHAGTLDANTRSLVGEQPRNSAELTRIVQKIPYCGVCACEESDSGSWQIVCPPIPTLTHAPNARYDWRLVKT